VPLVPAAGAARPLHGAQPISISISGPSTGAGSSPTRVGGQSARAGASGRALAAAPPAGLSQEKYMGILKWEEDARKERENARKEREEYLLHGAQPISIGLSTGASGRALAAAPPAGLSQEKYTSILKWKENAQKEREEYLGYRAYT